MTRRKFLSTKVQRRYKLQQYEEKERNIKTLNYIGTKS